MSYNKRRRASAGVALSAMQNPSYTLMTGMQAGAMLRVVKRAAKASGAATVRSARMWALRATGSIQEVTKMDTVRPEERTDVVNSNFADNGAVYSGPRVVD